ncbi:MAG TPA: hypothetical protein VEU62_05945, partial [Bryobacterales bacterium]|nr:hypothetical protein [Bryobacterales bacterium]
YIAAVGDSSRPPLTTRWLGPNRLEVRGDFPAGRVVSLRVSYAEGWRAWQGGERIPIGRDPLGFMTLHPQPEPDGCLRLEYAGSLEQRVCGWISFVTLAAAAIFSFSAQIQNPPRLVNRVEPR